jgi:hypothetical protein
MIRVFNSSFPLVVVYNMSSMYKTAFILVHWWCIVLSHIMETKMAFMPWRSVGYIEVISSKPFRIQPTYSIHKIQSQQTFYIGPISTCCGQQYRPDKGPLWLTISARHRPPILARYQFCKVDATCISAWFRNQYRVDSDRYLPILVGYQFSHILISLYIKYPSVSFP